MRGHLRILVAGQHDLELAARDLLGHLVRIHPRDAAPGDRGGHRRIGAVDDRRGMNWTVRGTDEPAGGAKVQELGRCAIATIWCLARSPGSLDARMLLQIARRGHHDAADLADPHRHHRQIREMADAQRDVDALLDQIDRRSNSRSFADTVG